MSKYTSYKEEVIKTLNDLMYVATEAVAKNTELEIKKIFTDFPKPPIETGNLRRNIFGKVIGLKDGIVYGEVRSSTPLVEKKGKKGKKAGGKEVEYAKYIEFGTYKMQPRPFMRLGAERATKKNQQILKQLFSKYKTK